MATTCAKDIRPLFRAQDIACMSKAGVRLGDAAWMCEPAGNNGFADHGNARHVYAALERGVMPPDKKWLQQMLDTYKAWMTGGFEPGS
jgi:hypothetical protein